MRHSDTEIDKMLSEPIPKDAADRAYPYAHAAGHWQARCETLVGWLREANHEIDRLKRALADTDN